MAVLVHILCFALFFVTRLCFSERTWRKAKDKEFPFVVHISFFLKPRTHDDRRRFDGILVTENIILTSCGTLEAIIKSQTLEPYSPVYERVYILAGTNEYHLPGTYGDFNNPFYQVRQVKTFSEQSLHICGNRGKYDPSIVIEPYPEFVLNDRVSPAPLLDKPAEHGGNRNNSLLLQKCMAREKCIALQFLFQLRVYDIQLNTPELCLEEICRLDKSFCKEKNQLLCGTYLFDFYDGKCHTYDPGLPKGVLMCSGKVIAVAIWYSRCDGNKMVAIFKPIYKFEV